MTTVNWSRRQASTACPGGPEGLRNAETQTLLSSRATSGTAFRLDLGPCASHLVFDDRLRDRLRSDSHPSKHAVELRAPLRLWIKCDQDAGLLLKSKRPQGPQNPVLVHGSNRSFERMNFFRQRHDTDYTDAPRRRQVASAQSRLTELLSQRFRLTCWCARTR